MHPAIAQHRAAIARICVRFGIRRLDVFGSAARVDDFDPEASDVDFLVEFAQPANTCLQKFFDAKQALEVLLGREVDLVEQGAIHNPFVLKNISRSRESVYEAA